MRRIAGKAVEIGYRNRPRCPIGLHRFDGRIEHAHGDGHVAGVGGDAGLAGADYAQLAAETTDGSAATAGLALVARHVGVVKIGASGPLKQVACRCRLVAQLSRSARQQRAAQHAIVAAHRLVGRQVSIADQRADAQSALWRRFDPVEAQMIDVDQVGRRFDLELHQVEQIGAAGNEARTLHRSCGLGGIRNAGRAAIGKRLHAFFSPATSFMAAMMLG